MLQKLVINDKTNRGSCSFNISIDGKCLQPVDSVKFLGVYIDSKLSWTDHISNIASQIAKAVGIL